MRREKKIIEKARSIKKVGSHSAKFAKPIADLRLDLMEENDNEGKKLSHYRKMCSKLKPNLINEPELIKEPELTENPKSFHTKILEFLGKIN